MTQKMILLLGTDNNLEVARIFGNKIEDILFNNPTEIKTEFLIREIENIFLWTPDLYQLVNEVIFISSAEKYSPNNFSFTHKQKEIKCKIFSYENEKATILQKITDEKICFISQYFDKSIAEIIAEHKNEVCGYYSNQLSTGLAKVKDLKLFLDTNVYLENIKNHFTDDFDFSADVKFKYKDLNLVLDKILPNVFLKILAPRKRNLIVTQHDDLLDLVIEEIEMLKDHKIETTAHIKLSDYEISEKNISNLKKKTFIIFYDVNLLQDNQLNLLLDIVSSKLKSSAIIIYVYNDEGVPADIERNFHEVIALPTFDELKKSYGLTKIFYCLLIHFIAQNNKNYTVTGGNEIIEGNVFEDFLKDAQNIKQIMIALNGTLSKTLDNLDLSRIDFWYFLRYNLTEKLPSEIKRNENEMIAEVQTELKVYEDDMMDNNVEQKEQVVFPNLKREYVFEYSDAFAKIIFNGKDVRISNPKLDGWFYYYQIIISDMPIYAAALYGRKIGVSYYDYKKGIKAIDSKWSDDVMKNINKLSDKLIENPLDDDSLDNKIKLEKFLNEGKTITGKPRQLGAEDTYKKINKALNMVKKQLLNNKELELYGHLNSAIRYKEGYFEYKKVQDIDWEFRKK